MFKKIIKVFEKILEILRKPKLRKVLTQKIILAKGYLSIISLIPEVKYLKNKKILVIFYDKAKEIAFDEKSVSNLRILKTNFTNSGIDPKKDCDYISFILCRIIVFADSYNKFLMIQNEIRKNEDSLRSLKPIEKT